MNNYNCEGINYPSKIKDLKRFGKNNLAIALNILNIKNKKNVQLIFYKLIQIVKKSHSPDDSEYRKGRL